MPLERCQLHPVNRTEEDLLTVSGIGQLTTSFVCRMEFPSL